jgi:hypothetical protein
MRAGGRRLPSVALGLYRVLLEQQAKNGASQLRTALLAEGAGPGLCLTRGKLCQAAFGPSPLWPAAAVALQPHARHFHCGGIQWQQAQPAADQQQAAQQASNAKEAAQAEEAKPAPLSLPDAGRLDSQGHGSLAQKLDMQAAYLFSGYPPPARSRILGEA